MAEKEVAGPSKGARIRAAGLIGALVLATAASPAAAKLVIERIEPANSAIVFIVEPSSGRKFQGYEGATIGDTETLQIDGAATRVSVRDTVSGKVSVVAHAVPLRAPVNGPLAWLHTRMLDMLRLGARAGSTQSGGTCPALLTETRPEIPILARDDVQLARGERTLVLPLTIVASSSVSVSLFDPADKLIESAPNRGGYWIAQPFVFTPGRYKVRLTADGASPVEHFITVVPGAVPTPPAEATLAADRIVWLAATDGGHWRLEALARALAVPQDERSNDLKTLTRLLGQGMRLDRQRDVAQCLG